MLQPVGPLPSQVYWRRRLVILGGIVVVLLLGLAMCSGSGGTTPRRTTNGAALTGPATPTSTAPGATTGPATITPSPGSAGGPAPGAPATSTAGTGEPGSTDPGSSGGPGGSGGSGGGPVGGPGSSAAPQPCPDEALLVQAAAAEPSYHVGETPVLRLTVRNTGSAACVRDVGPRQQEMLLYSGTTRLWSSNDCYPDGGTDIRTLAPGEQVTSTVVWSGLSSQRGCAGTRTRVKAGTYQLTARVGSAHSKPAKLVLN